jgi:(R)-2-hydroxyacyl-CoA dehydratese activating ATPase
MICAGIDGGSRAIKIAVIDADSRELLACGCIDQGVDHNTLTEALFDELLEERGFKREDVGRIVATGYMRNSIRLADTTVTEITCHAVGVRRQVPQAMTIVEIGGQDSKLLRLDASGAVRDFAMNDRCAAGTGRFLEMIAAKLETGLSELGELASRSTSPAHISSTCVVFAETEVIGLLASGVKRDDIVAGVQASICQRVSTMAGRSLEDPVVFTGGVALVPGMSRALESALGHPISVAPQPQITGALGAAILAARK